VENKTKATRRIALLWLVALIIAIVIISGCRAASPNLPNARDLCLTSFDLYVELDYHPNKEPIADDEFSREYDPYPKIPSGDYETRYRIVFSGQDMYEINGLNLELTRTGSIANDVCVYRSVETAKAAFATWITPRFGFLHSDLGIPGKEWDIAKVGDESKAWNFVDRVLDEEKEVMVTQYEVEMSFRKGFVISSVEATVWGRSSKDVESFIVSLAQLSEDKISKAIGLPSSK
jgi:hypothetical protein